MNTSIMCTRRQAVKAAAITASAVLLSPLLTENTAAKGAPEVKGASAPEIKDASAPEIKDASAPEIKDASASEIKNASKMQADPLLQGVSDIHIHAAPDTRARSVDELNLARAARDAGYRSVMFKSNHWACHDRAWLVEQALLPAPQTSAPQTSAPTQPFSCFGSLCLNRVHGNTVNAYAAEQAVNTTGTLCRCIWLPTQDAAYQHAHEKRPGKGIPVLSDAGAVLPEVVKVMEICAEANIIFATGHSSPQECLVLARKAKEMGLPKFVVTHANSLIWKMTRDQILRIAELGAFIEYSYLTCLWGGDSAMPNFPRMSKAEFADFARIIPERTVITTDLGQINMPHPLEGMRQCIMALREGGLSHQDIQRMTRTIPAKLVGLEG